MTPGIQVGSVGFFPPVSDLGIVQFVEGNDQFLFGIVGDRGVIVVIVVIKDFGGLRTQRAV